MSEPAKTMNTSGKPSKRESYGLSAIWQQLETVTYVSRFQRLRQLMAETLKSILVTPITALFSLISIASALFVLGIFLLLFQNVETMSTASVQQLSVSVYLKERMGEGDISALTKLIENRAGVEKVDFLDKHKALELFKSAMADVDQTFVSNLTENPLPSSLEIKLQSDISRAGLSQLVNELRDLPGIMHVGYSAEIFDRARELIKFIKFSGGGIVLVMLLVTAFVVASTVRMMLLQREGELAIMRLVGATSFLIRFPCLMEGAIFGLAGGLLAIVSLFVFYKGLLLSIFSVAEFVPVLSNLHFLGWFGVALMLFVGTGIGLFASYVAARKI